MLIDITQVTKLGRVYRPGSPALKVEKIKCFKGTKKEYTTTLFSCAVHNMGTHIDVINADVILENERLVAPGLKFNISHIIDRPVELNDLDLSLVKKGHFVFFQTNWDKYLDDEEKYNKHPEISMEVIKYLVDKKVNMIGIDTLGLGFSKNHGLIDVFLGKSGIYAIENLTKLDQIPENNFTVYCLPMKIEGLDAFPARILVEI